MSSFQSEGRKLEKLVVMPKKELQRYTIAEQVEHKRLTQVKDAELLGVSERHFRRLMKACREEGAQGLISKKRGQPSNYRLPDKLQKQVIAILRNHYVGFGPTLAFEKLMKKHRIKVSIETLRKWMISAESWEPRRQRKPKLYQSRQRRERLGELIQVDGSPHNWFEGRGKPCCLLGFIDSLLHQSCIELQVLFCT